MCFKKKAKKSITVTPNPEYCIWVIPTDDLAYNAVVDIGSGCQLLYIVNGQLRSKEQARRVVVNPKKEKRAANKITLIGVNFNKVFEIMCGAGNIPYKDREIGAETVVGISADMKVRIRDGWKLYTMFGNKNITEQEVNELIRSKCAEILSTQLSQKLQRCTYHNLTKEKSAMSAELQESIAKVLDEVGVFLVNDSFALGDFFFQPEYVLLREKYGQQQAENEMENERLRLERKKARLDMETMESLARAQAQAAPKDTMLRCPNPDCGMAVPPGTRFCPSCGMQIKK